MSEWKKVKLGEILDFFNGKAIKVGEGSIPIYGSNGIIGNTNQSLYCNAIIIGRVGAYCGSVAFCNKDFWASDNTIVVKPKDDNNIPFCYYLLSTMDLNRFAGGAAQPLLTQTTLKSLETFFPSVTTQHRIATILSRYDTLIENYQKQIRLLEEAAQRLYKEWFVELRFPGHENTKMVDGLPEGWERKPVDSIYSIKYGKNLSTKLISENGEYPVYGANGVIGYYDKANCHEQVVLITSRGNGSGDVLMTYHKDAFITNNSFVVTPMEEYRHCQMTFTYHFLKSANFRSVRTGAAQPQLTNQSIHTVDVLLPSQELIVEFCKKTKHNNELIISAKNQIRLLTEARDRMLPRLMGGEMEVIN